MGTYVNNLRLLEIATGGEDGTWGTKTNLNLELIADAFGSGTEAITTNADTHTTTIADGAADEGRAIFLKYTGTLDSDCTITLAPNTVNKLWFIENATSGSQNIIISQGSGANITIGNGNVAAVYTDGAGSGAAVLDAFADLELSSTFTVAGNVDFNGDLDVDGTTNLDAVDIDGAVQIDSTVTVGVDDTGYDVKFFGATSGAYMLWDESADDLVLAGAAGLDVAGDIDVDGTTNLDVVDIDGAVDMASTLTVAGDVTVDTSTLKVDTSNNRVGVGTASPSANLHTNVTSDGNNLYIDNNGTQLAIGSTSGVNYINTQNGGAGLAFQANGSEKIRLDSSGNVGIGTSSPSEKLDVVGNLTVSGSVSKGSGSFKIDHPLPAMSDTHHLVHSFIEGPKADLIYRGSVALVDGAATVDLDAAATMTSGTWEVLCRDPQVWVQNEDGWTQVRGSISGSTLSIEAQDSDCTDTVSWLVVAERKDPNIVGASWTDAEGHVIVEPLKNIET